MRLLLGKMEEKLKELEDNSVDSIVTDPPYHLTSIVKRFGPGQKPVKQKDGYAGAYSRSSKGFMGKEWDGGDIAFRPETWEECWRVLKPGGHLIAFSSARTYHRMAVAIEDGGFEIRDQIMWCYNSGFPKSHNLGKSYDKKYGIEREVMGVNPNARGNPDNKDTNVHDYGFLSKVDMMTKGNGPLEGWGTALKPAHEPIVVARKPLSEKTVLANAEKWGTGGLNIEATRVPYSEDNPMPTMTGGIDRMPMGWERGDKNDDSCKPGSPQGRWPANLIHDGLWDDKDHGKFYFVPKVSKKDRNEGLDPRASAAMTVGGTGKELADKRQEEMGFRSSDARGLFDAKAKELKEQGILANTHPTVKPTDLMHYLIRMVTPAGGTVLDPFMGSGSTGKAAIRNGYNFIGIEMEEDSFEVAKARIEYETYPTEVR